MTVQGELNTTTPQIEFILCVEGVGWPADAAFSGAFQGRVFTTADVNGDLASVLGCTVSHGLDLPGSVSDSLDMSTLEYAPGGMDFSILDVDDYWQTNFVPLSTTGGNTIDNGPVAWTDTSIYIAEDTFTSAAGDVVWITGSEAVLLGARAPQGGTTYLYTGCTRGYLGTTRGQHSVEAVSTGEFGWRDKSLVYNYNPRWHDRRVMLLMHVPGEARANLQRIYTGRLANVQTRDLVNWWDFSSTAAVFPGVDRMINTPQEQTVWAHKMVTAGSAQNSSGVYSGNSAPATTSSSVGNGGSSLANEWDPAQVSTTWRGVIEVRRGTVTEYERFGLAFAYHYRWAAGGTDGAYAAAVADVTQPQAYQSTCGDYNRYHVQSIWSIDGNPVRVLYKIPVDLASSEQSFERVVVEALSPYLGYSQTAAYTKGVPIKFLLSNWTNQWKYNRFALNRAVKRNPIDVMLMFLTSMPIEYVRKSANAGGTTTRANFASIPGSDGLFDGYALFAVDEDNDADNWGYARLITDYDVSNNRIDCEALPAATSNTAEYQVRNSIYDVLPLGFGMGVHNSDIDIASFEDVRDRYMATARVGRFALGSEDTDLWDMLVKNISVPYGVLMYPSRTTGKLTARYIEYTPSTDGLTEAYETVSDSDILEVGTTAQMPSTPTARYELMYRGARNVDGNPITVGANATVTGFEQVRANNILAEGDGATLTIKLPELEAIYPRTPTNTYAVSAMLHSEGTIPPIAGALADRLVVTSRPPPTVELTLNAEWIPKVQPGQLLSVTSTTHRPLDPYNGTRGWTNQLCRVIATSVQLSSVNPGIRVTVEVLNKALRRALIAPACAVTSKGTHGGGAEYFAVELNNYGRSTDYGTAVEDWDGLAVGDLIELRDITGALKESETIASFGANESETTAGASTDTVNVVNTIASAIAAGDYITLATYVSASVTDNMKQYSYYADTSELLDTDNANVYG